MRLTAISMIARVYFGDFGVKELKSVHQGHWLGRSVS